MLIFSPGCLCYAAVYAWFFSLVASLFDMLNGAAGFLKKLGSSSSSSHNSTVFNSI